jgi:hypothetical protein
MQDQKTKRDEPMHTTEQLADRVADAFDLTPAEKRAIQALGDVTITVARLIKSMEMAGPKSRAEGAKKIFKLREGVEYMFSMKGKEPGPLLGWCLACETRGLDLSICPHGDINRMALICMAGLRLYPEYDFDVMAALESGEDVEDDDDIQS